MPMTEYGTSEASYKLPPYEILGSNSYTAAASQGPRAALASSDAYDSNTNATANPNVAQTVSFITSFELLSWAHRLLEYRDAPFLACFYQVIGSGAKACQEKEEHMLAFAVQSVPRWQVVDGTVDKMHAQMGPVFHAVLLKLTHSKMLLERELCGGDLPTKTAASCLDGWSEPMSMSAMAEVATRIAAAAERENRPDPRVLRPLFFPPP